MDVCQVSVPLLFQTAWHRIKRRSCVILSIVYADQHTLIHLPHIVQNPFMSILGWKGDFQCNTLKNLFFFFLTKIGAMALDSVGADIQWTSHIESKRQIVQTHNPPHIYDVKVCALFTNVQTYSRRHIARMVWNCVPFCTNRVQTYIRRHLTLMTWNCVLCVRMYKQTVRRHTESWCEVVFPFLYKMYKRPILCVVS